MTNKELREYMVKRGIDNWNVFLVDTIKEYIPGISSYYTIDYDRHVIYLKSEDKMWFYFNEAINQINLKLSSS